MGQPYGCPAVQFIERNVYRIPLIAPVIPNQRVMRSGKWILKEFWRTGLLCKKCLLSYVIEGTMFCVICVEGVFLDRYASGIQKKVNIIDSVLMTRGVKYIVKIF